ncbi:MAG TPA: hypothetical protein VIY48_02290 [Candidatus Paceibacterota bacterium]
MATSIIESRGFNAVIEINESLVAKNTEGYGRESVDRYVPVEDRKVVKLTIRADTLNQLIDKIKQYVELEKS